MYQIRQQAAQTAREEVLKSQQRAVAEQAENEEPEEEPKLVRKKRTRAATRVVAEIQPAAKKPRTQKQKKATRVDPSPKYKAPEEDKLLRTEYVEIWAPVEIIREWTLVKRQFIDAFYFFADIFRDTQTKETP